MGIPQNEWFKMEIHILPSGYLTVRHGKSPCLRTVNHLFQWAMASMAMLDNKMAMNQYLLIPFLEG